MAEPREGTHDVKASVLELLDRPRTGVPVTTRAGRLAVLDALRTEPVPPAVLATTLEAMYGEATAERRAV